MNLVELEELNAKRTFGHFSKLNRHSGTLHWQNTAMSYTPIRMFDMAESMVNDGTGKVLRLKDLSGNGEHLTDTNANAALRALISGKRLQTSISGTNAFFSSSTSTNILYAHGFAVLEFDENSFQAAALSRIIGSGSGSAPSQVAYNQATTERRFYNASNALAYTETAAFPTGKGILEWTGGIGGIKWNGQTLFPSEAGSTDCRNSGLLIGCASDKASGFTSLFCDAVVVFNRGISNEFFDNNAAGEVRVSLANYYQISLP